MKAGIKQRQIHWFCCSVRNLLLSWNKSNNGSGGGGGGGGGAVRQILTLFQTDKCHFPHPFSDQTSKIHTRFETNYAGQILIICLI